MTTITIDTRKHYPVPVLLSAHGLDFDRDATVLANALLDCLVRGERCNHQFKIDDANIQSLIERLERI